MGEAGASEATVADLVALYSDGLPLILNLPGILFPLSMIALGIALWPTRVVPAWTGIVLALAGAAFLVGRFPGIYVLYPRCGRDVHRVFGWMDRPAELPVARRERNGARATKSGKGETNYCSQLRGAAATVDRKQRARHGLRLLRGLLQDNCWRGLSQC